MLQINSHFICNPGNSGLHSFFGTTEQSNVVCVCGNNEMQEDTIYLTEEVCIQAGLDDVSENSTTKVVGEWCSLFSVSHTFLLTTLDIPSSDSSSSVLFSSPSSVSASWVRNTGIFGFHLPPVICPHIAVAGICWR